MNLPALNYITIANALDIGLVLIFVAALGLILVKTADLYFSERLYGRPSLVNEIQSQTQAELTPVKVNELRFRVEEGVENLEKGLPLLATIAATAPFVGLGGTVLHIIQALSKISGAALDVSIISGPISTALFSTLMGLASAVLASVFYNVFVRKLQTIEGQSNRIIARAHVVE